MENLSVYSLKQELIKSYSDDPDGRPNTWVVYSNQMFGAEEAVQVWKNLNRFLPPLEADLDFVGPTANIGTHEVAIWNYEQQVRRGRVRFELSDLRNGQLTATFAPAKGGDTLTYHQADAEELAPKLGQADVIWDRKGWLWYLARRCDHQPDRVIQTFQRYAAALKDRGIVVVDAIQDYMELYEAKPEINLCGQYEHSTATLMDRRLDHPRIQHRLHELFEVYDLGRDKFAVRVLRKKPVVV